MPQSVRIVEGCEHRVTMRVAVVGNGPSAATHFLAEAIDSQVVVRMKQATTDPIHRGIRTDFIVTREKWFDVTPKTAPWLIHPDCIDASKWAAYFAQFSGKKPSTGLCAVFCVMDVLEPDELVLAGFDDVFHPPKKQRVLWGHDSAGEKAAICALGVPILELSHASIH
jgi:hypothetical protein